MDAWASVNSVPRIQNANSLSLWTHHDDDCIHSNSNHSPFRVRCPHVRVDPVSTQRGPRFVRVRPEQRASAGPRPRLYAVCLQTEIRSTVSRNHPQPHVRKTLHHCALRVGVGNNELCSLVYYYIYSSISRRVLNMCSSCDSHAIPTYKYTHFIRTFLYYIVVFNYILLLYAEQL